MSVSLSPGSRHRQPAVAATSMTTATERKLAPRWERGASFCLDDECPWEVQTGVYINYSNGDGACEKHAESMGVFAADPSHPVPDAAMRDLLWGNRAADQLPRSPVSRSELERAVATIAWLPNKQCSGESRRSSSWVDHCQLDEGHGGDHAWPSTGAEEMIARQRREMLDYRAPATSVVIDEATNLDEAAFKRLCSIVPDSPRWSRQTFAIAKPVAAPRCGTCTHVHAGPCNGTSPFGDWSCPCGHPKAVAKLGRGNIVGTYGGSDTWTDQVARRTVDHMNNAKNYTATLHANLAREKPPGRRPIRTVARYEGNSDD